MRGKYQLELNWPGDGRLFLNFWDWYQGKDVVCEVIDNKLFLTAYDAKGNELPPREISFPEYLELVKDSINARPENH